VQPVINNVNSNRIESYNDVGSNKDTFIGAAIGAAIATVQKHTQEQAAKSKKPAAE
jgi:hypothetical protein